MHDFDDVLDTDEGWAKDNRHYWLRDWRGFAEFFFGELLPEPHSTKQREDCVGWAMETSAETILRHDEGPLSTVAARRPRPSSVGCGARSWSSTGEDDRCQPWPRGERVAELTGGDLLLLDGAGHMPQAREPVVVNHAIREFADRFRPPAAGRQRTWTRPLDRPKRVLYTCPPDRPRPRPPGPGDRRRAAQAPARAWRCTGWPSIR